jgi:hypothetical protein
LLMMDHCRASSSARAAFGRALPARCATRMALRGSRRALICTLPLPAPSSPLLPLFHHLPQQRALRKILEDAPQISNASCPGAPQDSRGPPGRIPEDYWTSLLHLDEFNYPPPPRPGLTAPSLPEPGRLGGRSQEQLDFLDLSNRTCRGPPASGSQGVLRGRHAASRPLGRRTGTQHGRQKRPIQAVSTVGVKNRSDFSLEFNLWIYHMQR